MTVSENLCATTLIKMTNKTKLHVGRPNIGNRERFLQRVNEILDRRWLSNYGPVAQEVDKKVTGSVL